MWWRGSWLGLLERRRLRPQQLRRILTLVVVGGQQSARGRRARGGAGEGERGERVVPAEERGQPLPTWRQGGRGVGSRYRATRQADERESGWQRLMRRDRWWDGSAGLCGCGAQRRSAEHSGGRSEPGEAGMMSVLIIARTGSGLGRRRAAQLPPTARPDAKPQQQTHLRPHRPIATPHCVGRVRGRRLLHARMDGANVRPHAHPRRHRQQCCQRGATRALPEPARSPGGRRELAAGCRGRTAHSTSLRLRLH